MKKSLIMAVGLLYSVSALSAEAGAGSTPASSNPSTSTPASASDSGKATPSASTSESSKDLDISKMGMPHRKLGKCLKEGWKSASPTEDQNSKAKEIMESTKAFVNSQKANIKKDKEDVMRALANHPIDPREVEEAKARLHASLRPVSEAIQNGLINILNLLSPEQKQTFNNSVKCCLEKRKSKGRASEPKASQPQGSQPQGSQPQGSQPQGSQPQASQPVSKVMDFE